jgi:hypothetical protein
MDTIVQIDMNNGKTFYCKIREFNRSTFRRWIYEGEFVDVYSDKDCQKLVSEAYLRNVCTFSIVLL